MKKISPWMPSAVIVVVLTISVFAYTKNPQAQQPSKSNTNQNSGQHGIGHVDVTLCTGTIRQNCQHAAPPQAGSRGETSSVAAKAGKVITEAWLTPTGDFKNLSAFDLIEVTGTTDGNVVLTLRSASPQQNVSIPARIYFVFQE